MRLLTRLIYFTTLLPLITTIQAAEIRGLDNKCLDAAGESSENGTHLILWECTGRENQNWYFTEKGELRGINNKCVDAAGNSKKNGTQLILWDCNGGENQQWHFSDDGQIQGMGNKCFDMTGNVSDNGTKITLWKCHSKVNQQWRTVSNDNNMGSAGQQQREKKRWYHGTENNINRPNQRQSSVSDDDSRHERGYAETNRPTYPNYPDDKHWDNNDNRTLNQNNNRWDTPKPKNEALCQSLYDIHNKCYAVGAVSEGTPIKRAKACDRAVNNSQQEIAQSTDFVNYTLYGEVAATVCTNACKNGINANGAPSYEEFSHVCQANGL